MVKKRRNRKPKSPSSMKYLTIVAWVIFVLILLYCFREPIKSFFSVSKGVRGKYNIESADLEIPGPLKNRQEQHIRHTGYTVSYNEQWKIPNWVAYELTRDELGGDVKRTNKFMVDPMTGGVSATNPDYLHSGFDKGHMAPAGDMKWSKKAMKESFYFSNMCPQRPGLNRGAWKVLEEKIRDWAVQDSAIYIVCGPLVKASDSTIGKNKVKVPHGFFKVVLSPYTSIPKGIAFIFENKNEDKKLTSYVVSIDSVESLTGMDFFPTLPDELEDNIESTVQISDWNFK